ncbi:PTS sugar transporter subunit IIB, partial [Klebsiella pneumoniae]
MLVIRTVCGNGIGSSLMAANNVKKICDELGIKADVASVDFAKEGANKRGNSSRLTQSFHFFMFEPIFSPVNALN